ncbi:DUF2513 domain-containing protein [Anaerovibrio sp. RM50]|uniref:DUF2513 domain-containing protein n=1 Tax=Anaerovibrio sp. RM50 TaxID=1200557 RepID=UPI0004840DCF|nr:DUF2513 domain-containing protein [Anaerovibrio sp. RM50]
MRLNHDLIRTLLLFIEEISDGQNNFLIESIPSEFPAEEPIAVTYHIKYLRDAGLIEAIRGYIIDITPQGREYLDSIRDDSIWNNTKEKIKPFGNVALDIISSVAKSYLLSKLGI